MLSFEHEILAELFRRRGELAPPLLRTCAAIDLAHHHVERDATDLTQIAPTQFHADAVVRLCGPDGKTTAAVIVEVQLQRDDDKRFSWPVYVTALRASLRCPVFLLVVAPDAATVAWANKDIAIGQVGFVLRPSVIALSEVPRIDNAAEAQRLPELSILSAIAHDEPGITSAAEIAISTLPEHERRLYLKAIQKGDDDMSRREMMEILYNSHRAHFPLMEDECDTPLAQAAYRMSERRSLRHTAVIVLKRKTENVSNDDRDMLELIEDRQVLTSLVIALSQAPTPDEARAVFDAAVSRAQQQPS